MPEAKKKDEPTIKVVPGPKANGTFGFRISEDIKVMCTRDEPASVPASIARPYINAEYLCDASIAAKAAKQEKPAA